MHRRANDIRPLPLRRKFIGSLRHRIPVQKYRIPKRRTPGGNRGRKADFFAHRIAVPQSIAAHDGIVGEGDLVDVKF